MTIIILQDAFANTIMREMFADRHHRNVSLITKDGIVVDAHSCVLAAVSPSLKAQFKEGPFGRFEVRLPAVDFVTCEVILELIYVGKVEWPDSMDEEEPDLQLMLKAAQKLQMQQVVKSIEEALKSRSSMERGGQRNNGAPGAGDHGMQAVYAGTGHDGTATVHEPMDTAEAGRGTVRGIEYNRVDTASSDTPTTDDVICIDDSDADTDVEVDGDEDDEMNLGGYTMAESEYQHPLSVAAPNTHTETVAGILGHQQQQYNPVTDKATTCDVHIKNHSGSVSEPSDCDPVDTLDGYNAVKCVHDASSSYVHSRKAKVPFTSNDSPNESFSESTYDTRDVATQGTLFDDIKPPCDIPAQTTALAEQSKPHSEKQLATLNNCSEPYSDQETQDIAPADRSKPYSAKTKQHIAQANHCKPHRANTTQCIAQANHCKPRRANTTQCIAQANNCKSCCDKPTQWADEREHCKPHSAHATQHTVITDHSRSHGAVQNQDTVPQAPPMTFTDMPNEHCSAQKLQQSSDECARESDHLQSSDVTSSQNCSVYTEDSLELPPDLLPESQDSVDNTGTCGSEPDHTAGKAHTQLSSPPVLKCQRATGTAGKEKQRPTCPKCGKIFPSVNTMHTHKAKCQVNIRDYAAKSCHICNIKFLSVSLAVQHFLDKHGMLKPYVCKNCYENFSRHTELRTHFLQQCSHSLKIGKRRKFPKEKTLKPKRSKASLNIAKSTPKAPAANEHTSGQTNPDPRNSIISMNKTLRLSEALDLRCEYCDFVGVTLKDICKHVRTDHDEEYILKCKVCHKVLQGRHAARSHALQFHFEELAKPRDTKQTCTKCNRQFNSTMGLNGHLKYCSNM